MTPRPIARAPELLVPIDGRATTPLHRQVYVGLRDCILAGRLRAGEQLPATRILAADLGVSRTTVLQAIEQLRAEGYVVGRTRSGTYVTSTLPQLGARTGTSRSSGRSRSAGAAATTGIVPAEAMRSRRATEADPSGATSRVPAAFRPCFPALDVFPASLWARLTAKQWRRTPQELRTFLTYGDPAGYAPLRAAIAAYVTATRAARCTAAQVFIVGGVQQALDVAARLLLSAGDAVWMEDPGYSGARTVFAAAGATVVPVPIDGDGLRVEAGVRRASHARAAYVTPSHQYPLGVLMTASRRLELIDWAERTGAWIIEDDSHSDFRYTTRPLACLQGLSAERRQGTADRVLYISTFSRTVFPALRLGYLIVPEVLCDAVAGMLARMDHRAPTVDQAVLAEFIAEGHLARHIRRMRELYGERQQALIEAAAREGLDAQVTIQPAKAGLHVVGWLTDTAVRRLGTDETAKSLAAAAGIEARAITGYAMEAEVDPALVLGYATWSPARLGRAANALARALAAPARAMPG